MRIVAVGGKGFIGKALARTKPKEHELFVLDLPDADIRKPDVFTKKLKELKPDAVINLAALLGDLISSPPIRDMFETNTTGNINVAYATRDAGAHTYIFTSSITVHGENEKGAHQTRFSKFAPKHPYSTSKAAAEYSLQQFVKETKDMKVVTLRPTMVIGEGTPMPHAPIEFVRDVLDGKNIQIFGEGLHEREWISDRDVANGIWKALQFGEGTTPGYYPFFLTGNRIAMRDLAEKVVQKFGGKVVYVPKTVQAFSLTSDPSDSEEVLGWKVEDSIDAMLEDVARFTEKKV